MRRALHHRGMKVPGGGYALPGLGMWNALDVFKTLPAPSGQGLR